MASRPRRSLPVRILKWIGAGLLTFLLGSVLWVLAYRFVNPPITLTQAGDALWGNGLTRDWMPIERVDRDMVRAVIAGEDSKFCSHNGFDQQAIEAAMRRNASGGHVLRGGSTISQQTAKNVFLWQGGGYFRKGLEAWFTLLIEHLWDKRRIMEVYLNVAETGIGTYGVNAGAQRYYRHDASALSPAEAARIAAIFPLPKRREVIDPAGFTRRYGNLIFRRMGAVGRGGLDACVYSGYAAPREMPEPQAQPAPLRPQPARPPLPAEPPEQPKPDMPAPESAPTPPPVPPEVNGL
jgi:monofunctional biosynthetic peptidoglycan transglycosylase